MSDGPACLWGQHEEVDGTHISLDEMVAIYHVLESRKLSSYPADRAALERALCRLGPHGVLFPLKQRSVRMPA